MLADFHYRAHAKATYDSEQLDTLELALLVLVIELGLPIVALVQHLVASGGIGVAGILVRHLEFEARSANDGVDMGAYFTREDDRVTSLGGEMAALNDEEATLRLDARQSTED